MLQQGFGESSKKAQIKKPELKQSSKLFGHVEIQLKLNGGLIETIFAGAFAGSTETGTPLKFAPWSFVTLPVYMW